jgi:hypothetical protein
MCWHNEIRVYTADNYICQSLSHVATDSQSVCLSWCRTPSGAHDQIFIQLYLFSAFWNTGLVYAHQYLSRIHNDKLMYCFASVCDWIPRKENNFTAANFNVYKIYCMGSAASDVQRNTSKMVTWTSFICLAAVEQEPPPRNATSRKLMSIVTTRDITAQLDTGHNAVQNMIKTLAYQKVDVDSDD